MTGPRRVSPSELTRDCARGSQQPAYFTMCCRELSEPDVTSGAARRRRTQARQPLAHPHRHVQRPLRLVGRPPNRRGLPPHVGFGGRLARARPPACARAGPPKSASGLRGGHQLSSPPCVDAVPTTRRAYVCSLECLEPRDSSTLAVATGADPRSMKSGLAACCPARKEASSAIVRAEGPRPGAGWQFTSIS